jgi:uncharacterized protein YbjT (DUF2867 family)
MKITITGSLGHVGRPLTELLLKNGNGVTVVSHNESRRAEIESVGAVAAIGSLDDTAFLSKAFAGADAVFAMTPPAADASRIIENTVSIGRSLAAAIKSARVPRVVMLSSMGADEPGENGPISALHQIEKIYGAIEDTAFIFLRAGSFYLNFLQAIPVIKNMGIMGANIPADMQFPLVHPVDIAAAASRLLQSSFSGKEVHYIVSDVRTPKEIASVLGVAVGKPDLPWVEFTDEQALQGLKQAGLPDELARLLTEMNAAYRSGKLFRNYEESGSPVEGKVKLEDFANEFAVAFKR